jgi:hypothetical protein
MARTKSKTHSLNSPGMVAIIAALDRATASPHNEADGLLESVAGAIITHRSVAGWFDAGGYKAFTWTAEAIRTVVITYAENAPSGELRELARIAKEEHAWIEDWDRYGHDEAHGLKPRRVAGAIGAS